MSALTDTFTAIANAIRGKLGVQTTYTPTQMSSAIASIPTAKEEQTKSVTATTSQQTVTPDTGKVLSSVTVNPQVHSATYTPTGYSNANDMGAQNNYRYVDTSAYEPTNLTPSNSSPATITSGGLYSATAGGVAIESYSSITPSNHSPVTLSSGSIYKMDGAGKAVASVTLKTPSDTSPDSGISGAIIQLSTGGYLVKTVSNLGGTPDKTYANNSAGSSGSVDITVTKKPRYIILGVWTRGNTYQGMVGIIDVTKNQAYRMGYFTSAVAESWTNYTSYFTTISSTKVTYSYAGFSGNSRVQILIYY